MYLFAEPRDLAELTEIDPELPPGPGERFSGYGVLGLPFGSGHVLALRRFPASSLGPGYTSVWHRTPSGRWTFWSDVAPESSCTRYFGRSVDYVAVAPIRIVWTGPRAFRVIVGDGFLDWSVILRSSPVSVTLNAVTGSLPGRARESRPVLRALSAVAGPLLDLGRLTLTGDTPSGHRFREAPQVAWLVAESRASLAGASFGIPSPLSEQAWLSGFAIPQHGVFVIGRSVFERFDADQPSRQSNGTVGAAAA
jgi:hypothetical protein